MVALSRLKATFEACLGLFRQNMKTLGREWRRGGMQKPRRRVRRTEPLPTIYSLQYTRRQSNFGLRRMHGRGPPQSACPTHAGNLVLKPRRKQVFSGSDGGAWSCRGIWTYVVYVRDAIHWFLHEFNVDLVDTVQAIQSRSPFDVPCHCSFTQPNTCILSLASTAASIPLS